MTKMCERRGIFRYHGAMWDHWPLLLAGAAIWVALAWSTYQHFRHPEMNPYACPECGHERGLSAKRCGYVEDHSGWARELCHCQNDYHWNYESTTIS